MFDDYANLRPLKGAAEIIAQYDGWGQLFDLQQLSKNEVKVSSVSYVIPKTNSPERFSDLSYQVLR